MADEFDLKPTSRGEEFLDVILRSLGGDTPDIPQPAWRYEEYLAAIANAIQNGGGGSSGGGALKVGVTVTQDGSNTLYTLDKTYKELTDAINGGTIPYIVVESDNGFEHNVYLMGQYTQYAADDLNVKFNNKYYNTDSQNGYPVHVESGK